MFTQLFNWRTGLAIVAICIVSWTIFYSQYLAKKIREDEKIKIEQWAQAARNLSDPNSAETNLTGKVLTENNKDIPMITVNEKDSVLDHYNLDSTAIATDKNYLQKK